MRYLATLRWVLFATLGLATVMAWEMSSYRKTSPNFPPASATTMEPTIVTLELAPTLDRFQTAIDRGDRGANRARNLHVVKWNTYLDFAFIPLYCSLLILFALQGSNPLKGTAIVLAVLAGSFDYLEDVLLLHDLAALWRNASSAVTPVIASRIKWELIGLGCVATAAALYGNRSVVMKDIALLNRSSRIPAWVFRVAARITIVVLACAGLLLILAPVWFTLFNVWPIAFLSVILSSLVCVLRTRNGTP